MKLKSLRKLALSGVALAAAATTLGTSTFAWYVTNSEATVTGVKGTAQAGGLGNVLVAQKSTESAAVNGHGKFAKTQALSSASITQTTASAGLVPSTPLKTLTKTTATASASATLTSTPATLLNDSTIWSDAEGTEFAVAERAGKAFIEFDVWVLSSDADKVKFSFSIANTTASSAVTKQVAYAATGLPSTVNQGDSFAVNFVEALRIAYTQYTYTSTEQAAFTSAASVGTAASASVFFDNTKATASSTVADGTDFVSHTNMSGASANGYYDAVLGADTLSIKTGSTVNGTADQQITLTKGVESRLHFYVWLEGTDEACFDSCSGQSFDIALSFTAVKQAQAGN